MSNELTLNTTKYSLRFAIALVNATARDASAACIARVNGQQCDTGHLCLVGQKRAQLPKTPTVVQQSLSLPQPYPLTNTRQVFNGYSSLRVFGFADQLLADAMIHIFGKSCFFAAALFQKTPRAFGAFLLQLAPQARVTHSNRVQGFGAINVPIAVNGDVGYAQVVVGCDILNSMNAKDYKHLNHAGIYLLRNALNGKVYVGQAGNIYHRIYDHLKPKNLRLSNPLYRAAVKYGWGVFACELLERVDNPEHLNERETFWIQTLRSHKRDVGYNICEFGGVTRNYRHSEESRKKMSVNRPDQEGELNPFFGRQHTAETKAAISKAKKGRILSEEHKGKIKASRAICGGGRKPKPVAQIDPKTQQIVKTWSSIAEASRELSLSQSTLVGVCQGKKGRKSCGGFLWKCI